MEETIDPEQTCVSQRSHFEHEAVFMEQLSLTMGSETKEAEKALDVLKEILTSYQEQPHLLDPHLEGIIQPVMTKLRGDVDGWLETKVLSERTIVLFRLLYLLTKTRGYKTIVKFMPHEVTDLEPVFEFLSGMNTQKSELWEVRYVCFIWLSLICMIPFDLKRIDSGLQSEKTLIVQMLDLCKKYLRCTGKERDGASLLVARLLSRLDLCHDHLVPFVEYSKERLGSDADVFETAGILTGLCMTYQLSPREALLPTLDDTILPLLTMSFFDKYENNSLIRKLRTKLTQRVGLCYLKPKIASWRYKRGNRSLRQNLEGNSGGIVSASQPGTMMETEDDEDVPESLETIIEILLLGLRDKDTIVRWSAAKGVGRITQRLPQELAEDVIGSLLELFEENTFINKSNQLDLSAVSDHTWHGASLAIAELARRGLLLPERLEETIPWIVKGLKFDLKRGSHSIGSHVRDACCYVCWSFARAYAPSILEPFVNEIATNLVVVSLFDREINVRRASSAAFQENVGRQGIFPHGIEIIQAADYFSVGNRNNAFLNIAIEIAKFDEYRYHLIQHLITITCKHWDKAMRTLASKALYTLVPQDPKYFIDVVIPYLIPNAVSTNMQVSHGALLAIAETSLALWEVGTVKEQYDTQADALSSIIESLPPKSLVTFGSEHIREAACHLITCLSKTELKQVGKLEGWKKVVFGSLERKEENVQEYAVLAFGAVAKTYGISKEEVYHCLVQIEISNQMVYGRRGYALALGEIDYKLYPEWLHDVLVQICKATQAQPQQENYANDAEAKRNAVIGLTQIIIGLDDELKAVVSYDDFQLILQTLHSCLTDYSTDQRGDVGSWVRVATVNLLQYILQKMTKLDKHSEKKYLDPCDTINFIGALLKQSVERIDKVRSSAGIVLCDLIHQQQDLSFPGHDLLEKCIHKELSWASPSDLYPVMVQILSIPEYRFELLTGLIASAGGLTESLVRHSSLCLTEYMDGLPINSSDDKVSLEVMFITFLEIFSKYAKQDRVTIPLLDVIGLLYESGTLSKVPNESLHSKLFTLIRKETFKGKNVRKLLSAIKVYIGLVSVDDYPSVRTKALQQLLAYLVHAFPRIRMEVSDQLFTQLSVCDEDEGVMEAIDILTGTDWTLSLTEIKPSRDQLYPLLNIPKPALKQK